MNRVIARGPLSVGLMLETTPEQIALAVLIGAAPFGGCNTTLYAYLAQHTPRDHTAGSMSLTPFARNTAMLLTPLIGAAVSVFSLQAVCATAAVIFALARRPAPPIASALASEPVDG